MQTQWAAGDTLQFWQQPVAFHLPFLSLSPRRRSNLTCPSFLHPPFRPRLPTQWTVPTTACCQSTHTHTRHQNTKQRGRTFSRRADSRDKAALRLHGMCVSRTRSPIFSRFCEEARADVDKTTAPSKATAAPKRGVTQQPANHSVHQPQECTHYRAAVRILSGGARRRAQSHTAEKRICCVCRGGRSVAKNRTIKRVKSTARTNAKHLWTWLAAAEAFRC